MNKTTGAPAREREKANGKHGGHSGTEGEMGVTTSPRPGAPRTVEGTRGGRERGTCQYLDLALSGSQMQENKLLRLQADQLAVIC